MSQESKQNKGRGSVDRKLAEAPALPISTFIASLPNAALLCCFFGGLDVVCECYSCRYKNGKYFGFIVKTAERVIFFCHLNS